MPGIGADCKSVGVPLPRFESLTRYAAQTAPGQHRPGRGPTFVTSRAVRLCPAVTAVRALYMPSAPLVRWRRGSRDGVVLDVKDLAPRESGGHPVVRMRTDGVGDPRIDRDHARDTDGAVANVLCSW